MSLQQNIVNARAPYDISDVEDFENDVAYARISDSGERWKQQCHNLMLVRIGVCIKIAIPRVPLLKRQALSIVD